MKIIVAENSGFCFGVEKAISMAFEKIRCHQADTIIYSLGPIVHNPQVTTELVKKGVQIIYDIENAIENSSVIIRSHGAPKIVYEIAQKKQIEIIDTTCPFVKRVRGIAEDFYNRGYTIAIIGDAGHPEVIGINGWCNNEAIIITNTEEVEDFPEVEKLCIVVQTTMSVSKYNEISKLLRKKGTEIQEFNTICTATQKRQISARELAKEVDAVVVIGGKNSANTTKLADICREEKPLHTYHIELPEELSIDILHKFNAVGITAGASTPHTSINEVVAMLRNLELDYISCEFNESTGVIHEDIKLLR